MSLFKDAPQHNHNDDMLCEVKDCANCGVRPTYHDFWRDSLKNLSTMEVKKKFTDSEAIKLSESVQIVCIDIYWLTIRKRKPQIDDADRQTLGVLLTACQPAILWYANREIEMFPSTGIEGVCRARSGLQFLLDDAFSIDQHTLVTPLTQWKSQIDLALHDDYFDKFIPHSTNHGDKLLELGQDLYNEAKILPHSHHGWWMTICRKLFLFDNDDE
jgi:hypothetical protein